MIPSPRRLLAPALALAWIGLALDEAANARSATVIDSPASRVRIRVIRTQEEAVMARAVFRVALQHLAHLPQAQHRRGRAGAVSVGRARGRSDESPLALRGR